MNNSTLPHLNPLCTGTDVLSTNSEVALEKFSSLRLEHFQLYAKQLCVSVRKAKALLKSDVRYKPQQCLLLINALIEEVGDVVVIAHIEKKKQSELLQTEVARLNSTIERLKAENLAQQVEIDRLREALMCEVRS